MELASDSPLEFLTPDPKLPLGYLSSSATLMNLKCGRQYEFRYVEGIKVPPAGAMVEGICHHDWLREHNEKRMLKGEDLQEKTAVEIFGDSWSDRSKDVEDLTSTDKKKIVTRATLLIRRFLTSKERLTTPVSAESKIELMFGGVPFIGYIDYETEDEVGDYKVTKRPKTRRDVLNSIQLAVYTKAKKRRRGALISFNKEKPGVSRVEAPFTPRMQAWAEQVVAGSARMIKSGNFPLADPSQWWCSETWCGYWDRCRGAKQPVKFFV